MGSGHDSTLTSSIYSETYSQMEHTFHSSREVVTLGLSLFVVGLGFGPILLAPLSEFYGRRPIYIVSTFFFLIWLIPCALARNMQTVSLTPPMLLHRHQTYPRASGNHRKVFGRFRRQCIPLRRWWNRWGPVFPQGTAGSNAGFHSRAICWTIDWTSGRR